MTLDEVRNKFKSAAWIRKLVGRDNFDTIQNGVESIFIAFSTHRREIETLKRRVDELESKAHNPCSCPCVPGE